MRTISLVALLDAAMTVHAQCRDTCAYSNDGACDDGGLGSEYSDCNVGTDCWDCGSRTCMCPPDYSTCYSSGYCWNSMFTYDTDACGNACTASFGTCPCVGSDRLCYDYRCGNTCQNFPCSVSVSPNPPPSPPPPPPFPPPPSPVPCNGSPQPLCGESCTYAFDGDCDDGGPGAEYSYCDLGQHATNSFPRRLNSTHAHARTHSFRAPNRSQLRSARRFTLRSGRLGLRRLRHALRGLRLSTAAANVAGLLLD